LRGNVGQYSCAAFLNVKYGTAIEGSPCFLRSLRSGGKTKQKKGNEPGWVLDTKGDVIMNYRTVCSLYIAGSAVCLSQAFGDTTETNTLHASSIVVIGSKLAAHELPASGEYLDTDDIRDYSYNNLNILARKMPGVYAQEETGNGLLPNISLRGVDTHRSQKVTLMEDGILTAPAAYSAPSAYYAPTLGRMHGLEVMKGSSQIKYGPHTTGGIINYLSTPVPEKSSTYMKSSYGSYNDIRIHANVGDKQETEAGNVGYLAEIYHHQTDGFKTIRKTFANDEQTGFDKVDAMVKLLWEPRTASFQEFEVKVGYTEFDANETYLGLSEEDFSLDPYQRYAASQFDNFTGEHWRSYLKHYIELSDDTVLTSMMYYNRYHRNWYKLNDISSVEGEAAGKVNLAQAIARGGNYLDTLTGANGGSWNIRANNRDYEMYGVQSTLDSEFSAGRVDHFLQTGARLNVDSADRFQWQDEYQVDGLGNVTNINYGAAGAAGNRDQQAVALALHLQDEITLDRLLLTPGVRYEHIENQYVDRNADNITYEGSLDVYALGINGRYDLTDGLMCFGGAYRGYSVPSPYDNLNKGMEEETSLSFELGSRVQHQAFNAQLIGFYTRIEDLISGGYVGGDTDTDGVNAGSVDSTGVEFSAAVDAGEHFDWGFKNPYWLAFTYTHAVLREDTNITDGGNIYVDGKKGNRVPYIPEIQVSCGTGIEFGKFGVDVTLMYVGETYTTANNTSEQEDPTGNPDARFGKTDAHVILNGATFWRVNPKARLFLNLHNILNQEYIASRHPYGPRPGQPFTVMGGLEVSF
jgi:Fe(3+) dicitrate transport protein